MCKKPSAAQHIQQHQEKVHTLWCLYHVSFTLNPMGFSAFPYLGVSSVYVAKMKTDKAMQFFQTLGSDFWGPAWNHFWYGCASVSQGKLSLNFIQRSYIVILIIWIVFQKKHKFSRSEEKTTDFAVHLLHILLFFQYLLMFLQLTVFLCVILFPGTIVVQRICTRNRAITTTGLRWNPLGMITVFGWSRQ